MSIKNSLDFFMNMKLTEKQEKIAKENSKRNKREIDIYD